MRMGTSASLSVSAQLSEPEDPLVEPQREPYPVVVLVPVNADDENQSAGWKN